MPVPQTVRRSRVLLSLTALAVGCLAPLSAGPAGAVPDHAGPPHHPDGGASAFHRLATYPVWKNLPEGVDPDSETVAEISDVSEDGRTMAYTDAAGGRIGFLDLSDPEQPRGLGSHDVSGGRGGEPTSVAIVGEYALVVVDDSDGEYTDPAGRLDVVSLAAPHDLVTSLDLGGQPDSIAISPDGTYAAVAIENERDEDAMNDPGTGDEGDLPQAPAGFVQTLDLRGDPASWSTTRVDLPAEALAGVDTPSDPEPEYVSINEENQAALTLQENNGVVVIDLPSASITSAWSAGAATLNGVDTTEDGIFNATDSLTVPREPDAITWVGTDDQGRGLVATADEGDWKGGSRGWTVFRAEDGEVVWTSGTEMERLALSHGLFADGRAADKGTEPEGIAFDVYDGVPYAFVGSERSNFVAAYDMTDPTAPELTQVLPTAMGPEGLLPVPERNLFLVSSEEDSAEDGYRGTVGVYRLGEGEAAWPQLISATDPEAAVPGTPLGWTALGALAADPRSPHTLWAASDSVAATGRLYRIDVKQDPAVITDAVEVHTADGTKPHLDIEGVAARHHGGFWAASEGETGAGNELLALSGDGEIRDRVRLPEHVAARLDKWGLEGVTTTGHGRREQVYVALQRPLEGEQRARIGRYTPATGDWSWFGYRLETTDVEGDWIGLSEIVAVDRDTLAVIERDKQSGPQAAIKRIYTVDLPEAGDGDTVVEVEKRLAHDVLTDLRATNGWTQEKLEGLAIARDGRAYAVTDNDGVDDATGETVFLRLGRLR